MEVAVDIHTEYFNYIESLKNARPNDDYDYTLTLIDPESNSMDEAPITLNFNSSDLSDEIVAELVLTYEYHDIAYNLIARTNRYQSYLKDMEVNRRAYEFTVKLDIDIYDHSIIIYRFSNGTNFNDYIKNRKKIKILLNKVLPKDINVLQYQK